MLISDKLYEHIKETYDVELNYDKLTWGSIAPDILPKYKLYRHYYDNSIDYVIYRIVKVIFANRFLDFNRSTYKSIKLFSRDIGIISHYLSDFTCRAHADKWFMPKSTVKHMKYENELNEYAKTHEFDESLCVGEKLEIEELNLIREIPKIKAYIANVIEDYLKEDGFGRDLDFALALNKAIFEYIVESIMVSNEETVGALAFEY